MKHIVGVVLAFFVLSCGEKKVVHHHHSPPPPVSQTQTQAENYLFNAKDFDLGTVTAMVKSNKVKGAEELEKFINADNGINNVDIDKDGRIDYIRVVESRPGDAIVLDFLAVPSSGVGDQKPISTLRFRHNTTTNEMHVTAAYPKYAHGYNDHFYSYHAPYRPGISVGQALFLAYLFSPTRVVYAPTYVRPVGYAPRARYSQQQLTTRRTTVRTTTKVSPVKKASRPASYEPSKSATKSVSKFSKDKPNTTGTSLSSRKGNLKEFSKRDSTKTKKKATGFGASTKKTGGFGSSSASKKKSSWGSSSSASKKKSSWGSSSSSSAKKKSSSWGSSSKSSGSSSWGKSSGSRRR